MSKALRGGSTTRRLAIALVAASIWGPSHAQQTGGEPPKDGSAVPGASSSPAPAEKDSNAASNGADVKGLAALAWLEGCWQGTVNQREFREHWLPFRGGMMIGAGQTVRRDTMQDYQFLRLETKPEGVFFTQFSGDRKESSFRLASTSADDKDTIFTFTNTTEAFPARLIYRRGTDGWLYETIEGTLNGSDRKVIYPLRRVDCESGELIHR